MISESISMDNYVVSPVIMLTLMFSSARLVVAFLTFLFEEINTTFCQLPDEIFIDVTGE
jgi:hypothetical protein